MGPILAMLLLALCAFSATPAASAAAGAPPRIEAARSLLDQNLALGSGLAGRPASPEQAEEARRLVGEGLARARAIAAEEEGLPAGHHLLGMLLCSAWYPTEVETAATDEETGQSCEVTVSVLRRGNPDPACVSEGLAELLRAVDLASQADGYRLACELDYAEALHVCGQSNDCLMRASALWRQRANLSREQKARLAGLLAQTARSLDRTLEEAHWLRELLLAKPGDTAAAERLAEIEPIINTAIAWESHGPGLFTAGRLGKPVLIYFTTIGCPWCRKLEKEVFADPGAIALSQRFVCIRVEAHRQVELARRYRTHMFPTVVLVDTSGQEVCRILGYRPVRQYLAEMRRALPPH